jgi:uncharacterized caspase-like protein
MRNYRRMGAECVALGLAHLLLLGSVSFCWAQDPDTSTRNVQPIGATTPLAAGSKWALLIGVTDYKNVPKLEFCVDDMELLADALMTAGGYEAKRIWFLSNTGEKDDTRPSTPKLPADHIRKADLSEIKSTLLDLRENVKQNDTLLIAFSGH